MSTPLPTSLVDVTARPESRHNFGWLREPLLHFLLIGGALFATDYALVERADDPHRIVVTRQIDQEIVDLFSKERNRAPNADEMRALRRNWLDNEILYREGIALQVDRGDETLRERVIFKALSIVDATVTVPDADEARLESWFEANRKRYDEPARFDFEEAALADNSESAVREFVAALNGGTPGDAKAGLRIFKGRPLPSLDFTYGPEFAKALSEAPSGEWRAFHAKDGWHAMRLIAVTPARPAVFQVMRNVVLEDWRDDAAKEQRTAAVRALERKYKVTVEADAK